MIVVITSARLASEAKIGNDHGARTCRSLARGRRSAPPAPAAVDSPLTAVERVVVAAYRSTVRRVYPSDPDRSANRQHEVDHRVEQEINLSFVITPIARTECDRAHSLDRQRSTVLEVGRDQSTKSVDVSGAIPACEETDAAKPLAITTSESINDLLRSGPHILVVRVRSEPGHLVLAFSRGERFFEALERSIHMPCGIAVFADDAKGCSPDRTAREPVGMTRGQRISRACVFEKGIDLCHVVARFAGASKREGRGHRPILPQAWHYPVP